MDGKTKKVKLNAVILLLLSFMLLCTASFSEKIYFFVDKNGVYHFTDIPDDPRYRPFDLWVSGLTKQEIKEAVEKIASKYKIDPDLILAMIKVESNFDHLAVSSKNAKGLMQIDPITQVELGLENPFDPYANIEAGIRYLRYLMDRYKDLRLTLAAYNAGPTTVDRFGGIPPYKETKNYIERVIKTYNQIKRRSFESVKLAK